MPSIHVHRSAEAGIFANAFAIETTRSVVVVDALLTRSEARAFAQELHAIRKPISGVLITHAHPDHVAGLSEWLKGSATPVYAVASVDRLIRALEEPKRAQWEPIFKDEWIAKWMFPNHLVEDGEAVDIDGLRFRVHELGPGGDCDANSIWIMEGATPAAFVGDLVFNGTHSYLADGHTTEWLRNLERVRKLIPPESILYPGHGDPGGLELLDRQANYLNRYRTAVDRLRGNRLSLTDADLESLSHELQDIVPSGKLAFMVGLSANAVATELAGDQGH